LIAQRIPASVWMWITCLLLIRLPPMKTVSDRSQELDDDQELVDDASGDSGPILSDRSGPKNRSRNIVPPGP